MPNRREKLFRATEKLAKYYGLNTTQDLAAVIALEDVTDPSITGQVIDGQSTIMPDINAADANSPIARAIKLLIDTSTGAPTTKTLVERIREFTNGASREEVSKLGAIIQIHYAGGEGPYGGALNFAVDEEEGESRNRHVLSQDGLDYQSVTVRQMLGNEAHDGINRQPEDPSTEAPSLSVILSNSTRVSPVTKFTNPVTIFLNGIPTVELNRAIPFVNMEFVVERPPISSGNKIEGISIPKFLLGAETVAAESTLKTMLKANERTEVLRVSLSDATGDGQGAETKIYTVGGVELLTAPQTMVMANNFDVSSTVRANPILDKFRPLMSLQDISINVVPSTGIMSFKTAEVTLVLHDRSRMPEIAEFIRPDFYSRNEITLEYGWNHPDGESEVGNNPYGELINGMRLKEKYMIRNSSFSFDDSGQVIIRLDLAMRGATEFDTELISSNQADLGGVVRRIRELEETIRQLRARVFPEGQGAEQREIRGVQVLNAAGDARNHLTFTREFRTQLRHLRSSLQQGSENPNVAQLLESIEEIYGTDLERRRGGRVEPSEETLAAQLRTTLTQEITNKITTMTADDTKDPFLITQNFQNASRQIESARGDQTRRFSEFEQTQFRIQVNSSTPVSLGKLLLHFIGEPLAMTGRYDDVQLIFYPFNIKAGKANRLNIANFIVDLAYFADEYGRYRLNHIGRDGTLTLRQFMQFVQDILVDDHAAPSYGISNLFETVVSSDGGSLTTRIKGERPEYTQQLHNILENYTPNGEFTMPVIDFYIETLPEDITIANPEANSEADTGKSILRLHIFDRAASCYDSLGALLQATRVNQINSLGNGLRPVESDNVNNGVEDEQRTQWNGALNLAQNQRLIEIVRPEGAEEDVDASIRFRGIGQENIKEFLMATMPYIIYGAGGSTIITANLASMQNQQLSTVNMLRSFRQRGEVLPNGEQPGNLPMQVIPTQLSLEMFGCPLIHFAQQFFIDFKTGTTADNIYAVSSLSHRISPGEFKSEARFVSLDAYGRYNSLIGRINTVSRELGWIQNQQQAGEETTTGE